MGLEPNISLTILNKPIEKPKNQTPMTHFYYVTKPLERDSPYNNLISELNGSGYKDLVNLADPRVILLKDPNPWVR